MNTTTNTFDPVAWLKHDHQIIRRHLEQLGTEPAASRPPTLDGLKKLLALHNAIEENLVYPTIAQVAQRRDAAIELFHQTAEADILLYSVSEAAQRNDETAFRANLSELTSGILEHVNVEETQVFPLLESAPPEVVQHLAHEIVAFRGALTTV